MLALWSWACIWIMIPALRTQIIKTNDSPVQVISTSVLNLATVAVQFRAFCSEYVSEPWIFSVVQKAKICNMKSSVLHSVSWKLKSLVQLASNNLDHVRNLMWLLVWVQRLPSKVLYCIGLCCYKGENTDVVQVK